MLFLKFTETLIALTNDLTFPIPSAVITFVIDCKDTTIAVSQGVAILFADDLTFPISDKVITHIFNLTQVFCLSSG